MCDEIVDTGIDLVLDYLPLLWSTSPKPEATKEPRQGETDAEEVKLSRKEKWKRWLLSRDSHKSLAKCLLRILWLWWRS